MPRYLYDVTNLHTQTPEVKSGKRRKNASHNKNRSGRYSRMLDLLRKEMHRRSRLL